MPARDRLGPVAGAGRGEARGREGGAPGPGKDRGPRGARRAAAHPHCRAPGGGYGATVACQGPAATSAAEEAPAFCERRRGAAPPDHGAAARGDRRERDGEAVPRLGAGRTARGGRVAALTSVAAAVRPARVVGFPLEKYFRMSSRLSASFHVGSWPCAAPSTTCGRTCAAQVLIPTAVAPPAPPSHAPPARLLPAPRALRRHSQ
ncbi:hypothetical protein DFJ74DRAFT_294267 [Hyaloraphidium curvatum]|nr:hypothetical protein DFJ74DRAFT_294267 [Hyaloraphidium curvatum]